MTISMVRGYAPPPSEGGAAYHGFSQFGYTHITQEGVGHSEPHEEAFTPVEHWNGYRGYGALTPDHPYLPRYVVPGLNVPGPLGGCGNCQGGPYGYMMSDAGGSGADLPGNPDVLPGGQEGPVYDPSQTKLPASKLMIGLGVAAVLAFMWSAKSAGQFGYAKRKKKAHSRRRVRR